VKSLLRVGAPVLALVTLAIACANTEEPAVVDQGMEGGTLPPAADASSDLDAGTVGDGITLHYDGRAFGDAGGAQ
jgi:hypothetical protein